MVRGALLTFLLFVSVGACSFEIALTPTVRMEKWNVSTITVALRSDKASICPREPVQLAVFADADHRKRDKHKRLETWAGKRGGGFGHVGFEEFSYRVSGGEINPRTGWFIPDRDMLATAARGFAFEVTYKREPDVAPASVRFPPAYDCVSWLGGSGRGGDDGVSGSAGAPGSSGSWGGDSRAGGSGGEGTSGSGGSSGQDGAAGPNVVARAMLVRTPFHGNVVLVALEGDVRDRILFDPARPLQLVAQGGTGGRGGSGGAGGDGGGGGDGRPGGAGGSGGNGGDGAAGGRGGPGGSITLIVDAAHPQLERAFVLSAPGGDGGDGGRAGAAGAGGAGGSAKGEDSSAGASGSSGSAGRAGASGPAGAIGTARIEVGDVAAWFGTLPDGVERVN